MLTGLLSFCGYLSAVLCLTNHGLLLADATFLEKKVCLSACASVCMCVCLPVRLCVCLPVRLSALCPCLPVPLSACALVCLTGCVACTCSKQSLHVSRVKSILKQNNWFSALQWQDAKPVVYSLSNTSASQNCKPFVMPAYGIRLKVLNPPRPQLVHTQLYSLRS